MRGVIRGVTSTRGRIRSTPVTMLVRPATFGSTRGVTVGLMVGVRGAMLRFGVRIIMACASAGGAPRYANGNAAMTSAIATLLHLIRRLTRLPGMGVLLRRSFREIDYFLAAQLLDQARE